VDGDLRLRHGCAGTEGLTHEFPPASQSPEISRFGGPVPAMFWFRGPDGTSLLMVQPSE